MSSYPGSLWAETGQNKFTLDTKPSGSYTTNDDDFRVYIRVDNGVTLHSVSASSEGEFIYIRNTSIAPITVVGDVGVTVNGAGTLGVDKLGIAIVVGENEYDLSVL